MKLRNVYIFCFIFVFYCVLSGCMPPKVGEEDGEGISPIRLVDIDDEDKVVLDDRPPNQWSQITLGDPTVLTGIINVGAPAPLTGLKGTVLGVWGEDSDKPLIITTDGVYEQGERHRITVFRRAYQLSLDTEPLVFAGYFTAEDNDYPDLFVYDESKKPPEMKMMRYTGSGYAQSWPPSGVKKNRDLNFPEATRPIGAGILTRDGTWGVVFANNDWTNRFGKDDDNVNATNIHYILFEAGATPVAGYALSGYMGMFAKELFNVYTLGNFIKPENVDQRVSIVNMTRFDVFTEELFKNNEPIGWRDMYSSWTAGGTIYLGHNLSIRCSDCDDAACASYSPCCVCSESPDDPLIHFQMRPTEGDPVISNLPTDNDRTTIMAADFNDDGYDDLLVINQTNGEGCILLNNTNSGFESKCATTIKNLRKHAKKTTTRYFISHIYEDGTKDLIETHEDRTDSKNIKYSTRVFRIQYTELAQQ